MLIGELAKRTGFSRDTIRFYEKQGLIRIDRRQRQVNNYKNYPDEILQKLLLIKKLKGFGFTLNETGDLLAMVEENLASCAAVTEKVDEKIALIDEKIRGLQQVKTILQTGVTSCLDGCAPDPERNCSMVSSA